MTRFRFLPEALTDLEQAAAWYEDQRPGLGAELFDEFDSYITIAIDSPGTGSLAGTTVKGCEIRRFRLHRFSRYAILLSVIDGIPTVLAFEHSSRRPRYWRNRGK